MRTRPFPPAHADGATPPWRGFPYIADGARGELVAVFDRLEGDGRF